MQRRLAAILAMDVVGYSRLIGMDETASHRMLRADLETVVAPILTGHGGRIDRIKADDVLAEFASVVRAVDAAVAVQAAMAKRNRDRAADRSVRFRIGMTAGEICSDGENLFGDTINIAFRLEALARPGGILVSQSVRDHLGRRRDLSFEARGALDLKNIDHPVMAYDLVSRRRNPSWSARLFRGLRLFGSRRANRWAMGLAAIAVAALAGLAGTVQRDPARGGPSIAVLPFSAVGASSEQQSFGDGLTHDIMTDLAKFHGLSVSAATATQKYVGGTARPAQIGRDLGVRYVLEGNIQWMPDKVRVNAQLIDARTERHVWADRFDGAVADLALAQDRITAQVVGVIGPIGDGLGILQSSELLQITSVPADSLLSYEHYLTGMAQFQQFDRGGTLAAQKSFERALSLDPNYHMARAALAFAYLNEYRLGWSATPALTMDKAVIEAERAVALSPLNTHAFRVLGVVRHYQRRPEDAQEALRRALALNPNDTEALILLGWVKTFAGEAEAGLELMQDAYDQTPFPPGYYLYDIAWGHFMLRDYARAAEVLEQRVPRSKYTHLLLGVLYTQLDRKAEAATEIALFRQAVPDYSVGFARRIMPFAVPEDAAHFLDALRSAGIPEGT